MRRYKLSEARIHKYIQIPKELFISNVYRGLSSDAKVLYGHLLDRMELSRKNGWVNENDDIYLIFTREEIQKILSISNKTCTKVFKELKDVGLIDEVRQGLNKPNLIYIGHIIYDLEGNDRKCRNYTSRGEESTFLGGVEITYQEVNNLHANKTNINKTNYIYKEKETLPFLTVDDMVLEMYKRYISSHVSDIEFNVLANLEETYNKELLKKAIVIACEYNRKNLNYIGSLLSDWCNKGLNSIELVDGQLKKWKRYNEKYKLIHERKIEIEANKDYSSIGIYT